MVQSLKRGDNIITAGGMIGKIVKAVDNSDEITVEISKGINVNIKTLRKDLALTYNADTTCPVTTGIFLRIVSEAAYEDFLNGEKNITPFWRVLNHESKTASKLACGINFIKKRRIEENII